MSHFFIKRPIFAWVIALFIVLFGALAIPQLPIAQYPPVAPPSVSISVSYPGATPQMMNESVISLIERELSGVDDLLYFESSSDTSGMATITVNFKPGTDIKLAQVDVQNQIKIVESRLPQTVRQNGLTVEAASSNFLMIVGLNASGSAFTEADLSDYFARNMTEELRRVEGVGKVQSFGAEKAMRIWLDPAKLIAWNLTVNDVTDAISQQNAQIAPGRIGDAPATSGQRSAYPLTVTGQLGTPEAFRRIVLKASTDGAKVTLGNVARVELGLQTYSFATRENGRPSTAAAIQLAPGANAVKTSAAVQARLAELAKSMPAGMHYSVPFDTSPFVKISIEKVIHTFIEAMILVFLVMYLFLQNVRYTFIPAIVAPVALLGTFTVMLLCGFSINVLTMFGMVLAIGIIVDDAIVVVENVERLMEEEGLSPREATEKAMHEITGAITGITLVLTAVFIPMGLASGSVGIIYRQFTLSMAVSILFSALLALTLTPALCATLLKPATRDAHRKNRFFRWFNHNLARATTGYTSGLSRLVRKSGRMMLVYVVLCAVLAFGFSKLPSAFLPEEDQGYFISSIQLPADATLERTEDVIKQYEAVVADRAGIDRNLSILGFSFAGSGSNSALAFTLLKDWDNRHGATARDEAARVQQAMASVPDATVMSLIPPPIAELGNSSGFTLQLEDRAGHDYPTQQAALQTLLAAAAQSSIVRDVYQDGLPDGTSINLTIDREKVEAMGVSFSDISQTLSGAMGSTYVNDFPNNGRIQQVIVQADAPYRMQLRSVLALYVRNKHGGMVPLSEFVKGEWQTSALQLLRYQGYPAFRITGDAAPGYSTGQAMAEMEKLATQLPAGFAIEWTGQSLQEKASASQAPMLMLLSMLVVFLVLAALYESWTIPFSVMLVVPLGLLGAVAAVMLRDMSNDVFFKVGMITIIGLSAKNAILIIEFAKQIYEQEGNLIRATLKAASMRLRPILMTSLAFTLGVVPLMLATGASATTQHAIGTGVFGGMISGTILAVIFVPAFFIFVMTLNEQIKQRLRRCKR
ncbi:multidrug efflux RND transporter permease subunit [Pantoea wallisii]|uniref:Efflux pump membrane transporter n=1 Tax=Pantoea wallisii TaxID=1076551 RepID=A0A1X1DDN2_9GAMM|nr:multidrug efflux RND transporter permease subunit [Pantoea wallisii]ORM74727.1 multidrug efflux RND transporter permease subunit [Pantoea wallisii]